MTAITAIALNTEELIEDAVAVGRKSLNLAQAARERDALALAHVEAIYQRIESEYDYRIYRDSDDDYDDWYADHFNRVHCTGCEQHCRLD